MEDVVVVCVNIFFEGVVSELLPLPLAGEELLKTVAKRGRKAGEHAHIYRDVSVNSVAQRQQKE